SPGSKSTATSIRSPGGSIEPSATTLMLTSVAAQHGLATTTTQATATHSSFFQARLMVTQFPGGGTSSRLPMLATIQDAVVRRWVQGRFPVALLRRGIVAPRARPGPRRDQLRLIPSARPHSGRHHRRTHLEERPARPLVRLLVAPLRPQERDLLLPDR